MTKLQIVKFVETGWGMVLGEDIEGINEIIDSLVEDVNSGEFANEDDLKCEIHKEVEQYIDDLQYI